MGEESSETGPENIDAPTEMESTQEINVFENSIAIKKLETRQDQNLKRLVIYTDFDNTLYQSDEPGDSQEVAQLLENDNIPCIVTTARSLREKDFQDLLVELNLRPDVIIGSNGTEIDVLGTDGEYHHDRNYENQMGQDWNWDQIAESATGILEDSNRQHRLLSDEKNVKPFHVAINVKGRPEDNPQLINQLSQVSDANFVYWGDKEKEFTIAYVPQNGGKRKSMEYVSGALRANEAIVAGDSTNDISMLDISEKDKPRHSSVLVGGSKPALVRFFSGKIDVDFSEPIMTDIFKEKRTSRSVKIGGVEQQKGPRTLVSFLRDKKIQPIVTGKSNQPYEHGFHNPWE